MQKNYEQNIIRNEKKVLKIILLRLEKVNDEIIPEKRIVSKKIWNNKY